MSGRVILLGGGPGDPGLLTLKGAQALKQAEVVVYDRLVAPELLDLTSPQCEKIYVGKQAAHHTMKQEEINAVLIEKARQGKVVVRLKGGDVYVFGRGGEEALALKQAGIRFEVIPGISSCLAGPAYAGIPVTQRGLAQGFEVVTAQDQTGSSDFLDFQRLVANPGTLVFMMGLSRLEPLMQGLKEAGKDPQTPCAVISRATCADQRVLISTIGEVAQAARQREDLISPALIVVGAVSRLHHQLYSPSRGRVLVARVGDEQSELAKRLRMAGMDCDEVQTGRIRFLPVVVNRERLRQTDWLCFTSRNGIRGFFAALKAQRLDSRALAGIRIAVIGSGCAAELAKEGIQPEVVPQSFNSHQLSEQWLARLRPHHHVLLVQGRQASSQLYQAISAHARCWRLCVYDNEAADIVLPLKKWDLVAFSCASSVQRLLQSQPQLAHLRCVAIGPATSAALRRYGVAQIVEAPQSRMAAMAEVIEQLLEGRADHAAGESESDR